MNRMHVAVVSLSSIGSSVISEIMRPLYVESLGTLAITNLDLNAIESMELKDASLIVLNLPSLPKIHVQSIRGLRTRGYRGKILVIVQDLKSAKRDATASPGSHEASDRHVAYLDINSLRAELVGMVRRTLALESQKFRTHPRYEIEQPARLIYSNNQLSDQTETNCVILNVSLGGACIELDSKLIPRLGSLATLITTLDPNKPPEELRILIAWAQPRRNLAGISFVHAAGVKPIAA